VTAAAVADTGEKKKLNICLVAQRFPVLGRASDHSFLWPIARGLSQIGHRVTVIGGQSNLGKSEVQRDQVQGYFLHDSNPQFAGVPFQEAAYEKFLSLHRAQPFDLVHCMDKSGYRISKNKKNLKVKVAYDVEATEISHIFSALAMSEENLGSLLSTFASVSYRFLTTYFGKDRDILKSADGVFVTSPEQRFFLERYYLFPDHHIYTVPYGLELGDLSAKPEAVELRKKYNLPESCHLVLTVTDMAVPEEMKNLLRAFERVAVKKPNAYLIMIGSGPGWKAIEFEMLNLALGSKTIMTGALSTEEVFDWISIADVFVNMSARRTGYEISLFEAMAQKKVIIGSEMSPVANVIEDSQDGFLLRPADTQSLAHLLTELFSGSIPTTEIAEKARQKVIQLFDPQRMIQSVEAAYTQILKRS